MIINEKLGLCLKDENHFISFLFTLLEKRRAGDFHLMRYLGRGIVHYSLSLKCLAYESLRLEF
jgi:hypothetical protein